jgi:hypothetical protein
MINEIHCAILHDIIELQIESLARLSTGTSLIFGVEEIEPYAKETWTDPWIIDKTLEEVDMLNTLRKNPTTLMSSTLEILSPLKMIINNFYDTLCTTYPEEGVEEVEQMIDMAINLKTINTHTN